MGEIKNSGYKRSNGNGTALLEENRISKELSLEGLTFTHDDYRASRLLGETANYQEGRLEFKRLYTKEGVSPYSNIEWTRRDAEVTDHNTGKVVFEQKNMEFPESWSQNTVDITASKYFKQAGVPTPSKKEESVKHLIDRVAKFFRVSGSERGYFADSNSAKVFEDELTHILVNQMAAFNSPVWFNVGNDLMYGAKTSTTNWAYDEVTKEYHKIENMYERPQCSACFIQKAEDSMEDILELVKNEGMLFKGGSGTGSNFSAWRSVGELLSNGGTSSGLMSHLATPNSGAGAMKSGGTTRRAAKMVIVNVDHPEIENFITWKNTEREKAMIMMGAGISEEEAYATVGGQNSNNSVRVTNEFIQKVKDDQKFDLMARNSNKIMKTVNAKDIMNMMGVNSWISGDPGVQFDDEINKWHTCPVTERINGSNPCSEYMFIDDSACNLSSLNLMKFKKEDGSFDVESYRHATEIMITAMEIAVGASSYPTKNIAKNSEDFRPLGIGYTNLGALIMSEGLAYDSDEGRALAGAVTSLLSGRAYRQSAIIAEKMGAFAGFEENKEPCMKIMKMHEKANHEKSLDALTQKHILSAAKADWKDVLKKGEAHGLRNSQISVLAPTGTISFLMSADSTGIEPIYALNVLKTLAGGGHMEINNAVLPQTLQKLGYEGKNIENILDYVAKNNTVEGAPGFRSEHLDIFDAASSNKNTGRYISPSAHLKMMAAAQPFISGAISKTVNLPEEATPEDCVNIFMQAHELGLKSVALYRDGSNTMQPIRANGTEINVAPKYLKRGLKRELPGGRPGRTIKAKIAGQSFFYTINEYPDGTPGEVFINTASAGSYASSLWDQNARKISMALQYGVPLEEIIEGSLDAEFDPQGFCTIDDPVLQYVRSCSSPEDLLARIIGIEYLGMTELVEESDKINKDLLWSEEARSSNGNGTRKVFGQTPPCVSCGKPTIRSGRCTTCTGCGKSSGGCS
jgi:ribonucleoside-diphosphate reductase alpha chain